MNLLEEHWIPVTRRGGARDRVAPCQLADPDILAFDAARGDFNGALAQFAIGLLQTTTPAQSMTAWRRLLNTPPDATTLQAWFAPHAAAFEFDGEGARFMQDHDLREGDGEPVRISGLLIETPGENAIKNNSDLFIKRGHVQRVCLHCAALALFTLQVNAPAGGAGHRTGLRGGGPLSTLLVASAVEGVRGSLWHTLWLNVRDQRAFLGSAVPAHDAAPHAVFPWLASISATQKADGQTTPAQVHPAHVYWAMPRRIRLDLDHRSAGTCDLCGRASEALVERYVTRNYGLNYKGPWRHPLTPYYESKEGLLPVHPQPDGLGYRHWLAWALGMQTDKRRVMRAEAIDQFLNGSVEERHGIGLRLWAFGYDMDNMKARRWYESTVPLYGLAECSREAQQSLREDVGSWLTGTELAASSLRGAIKDAWFGHEARGDFSFVDARYWDCTEAGFYQLLRQRMAAVGTEPMTDGHAASERWLGRLQRQALQLFDGEWVGAGPIQRMNPARVAAARRQLLAQLYGTKLREALRLPVAPRPAKARGKSSNTSGSPA